MNYPQPLLANAAAMRAMPPRPALPGQTLPPAAAPAPVNNIFAQRMGMVAPPAAAPPVPAPGMALPAGMPGAPVSNVAPVNPAFARLQMPTPGMTMAPGQAAAMPPVQNALRARLGF